MMYTMNLQFNTCNHIHYNFRTRNKSKCKWCQSEITKKILKCYVYALNMMFFFELDLLIFVYSWNCFPFYFRKFSSVSTIIIMAWSTFYKNQQCRNEVNNRLNNFITAKYASIACNKCEWTNIGILYGVLYMQQSSYVTFRLVHLASSCLNTRLARTPPIQ